MADTVRVGVIGANPERGWAAEAHLPALAALDGVELTAVATTRPASAAAAARRWGASAAYADGHELIEHADVDLVTVALQLPHRGDLVTAALAAGRNVYCEWPLALDAPGAARLARLAGDAGVHHVVGLQGRAAPAVRYLRQLVVGGAVGEVLSAALSYAAPSSVTLPRHLVPLADTWRGVWPGVNHLTVVGGHTLDMFRYVVGEFRELSATLATRTPAMVVAETGESLAVTSPDHVLVAGVLAGGAPASVDIRIGGRTGSGLRIAVHGRDGSLLLTSDSPSLVGAKLSLAVARDGDVTPLPVPSDHRPALPGVDPAISNVAEVYLTVADAIRTGTPVRPDFTTGAGLHRLLDAVLRSDATGTRQSLA